MGLESNTQKIRVRITSVMMAGDIESQPARHTFIVEHSLMYHQMWDKLKKIYGAELRNYSAHIIRK